MTAITLDLEFSIPVYSEICSFCAHFDAHKEGRTCKAFPRGIPDQIWLGQIDHTSPSEGDHGIQFEKRSKGSATKGGPGSGYHDHAGRPGEVGGSAPDGTAAPAPASKKKIKPNKIAKEYFDRDTLDLLANSIDTPVERLQYLMSGPMPLDDVDAWNSLIDSGYFSADDIIKNALNKKAGLAFMSGEWGRLHGIDPELLPDSERLKNPASQPLAISMDDAENMRQDFLETAKKEHNPALVVTPSGYVVTDRKHAGNLFKRVYGGEDAQTRLDGSGNPITVRHERSAKLFLDGFLAGWPTDEQGDPVSYKVSLDPTRWRACYSANDKSLQMTRNNTFDEYIHELGHGLEQDGKLRDGRPVWEITKALLAKRSKGKKLRKLSELDANGIGGYDPSELAYDGAFSVSAYAGKSYNDKNTTEVFTMGLQLIAQNALKLAQDDPELFNTTVFIAKNMRRP